MAVVTRSLNPGDGLTRAVVVMTGVTAHSTVASADTIPIAAFAAGGFNSATISTATVTFYGCHIPDGTFLQIYDSTGTAVSLTAASSKCIDIPAAVFSWPFLKIVVGASSFADLVVSLKG